MNSTESRCIDKIYKEIKDKIENSQFKDTDDLLSFVVNKCIREVYSNLTRYQENKLKKNIFCDSFIHFYKLENNKIIDKKTLASDIISYLEENMLYFYGDNGRDNFDITEHMDRSVGKVCELLEEEKVTLCSSHIPIIKMLVLVNLYADSSCVDDKLQIITPQEMKNILMQRNKKDLSGVEYLYRKKTYREFLEFFTYQIGLDKDVECSAEYIDLFEFYFRIDKEYHNSLSDTLYLLLKYENKYHLPHYSIDVICDTKGVNYSKIIKSFSDDTLLNLEIQERKKAEWFDIENNPYIGYSIIDSLYSIRRRLTENIDTTFIDSIYNGPIHIHNEEDKKTMEVNNDILCLLIANIIGVEADKYLSWINGYSYYSKRHIDDSSIREWQKDYTEWSSVARMITLISFETAVRLGCHYQFEVAWSILVEAMQKTSLSDFYTCYNQVCTLLVNDQIARRIFISILDTLVSENTLIKTKDNKKGCLNNKIIAEFCYNNLNK